jgi:hypothetical protein
VITTHIPTISSFITLSSDLTNMCATRQTSLSTVLEFQLPNSQQCSLHLPGDICYGSGNSTCLPCGGSLSHLHTDRLYILVSSGGFVASAMGRYAMLYASQTPKTREQTDIRYAHIIFYRPIFPAKGPVTMKLHEMSIGKSWSTFRIELFQENSTKIGVSADIM